MAITRSQRCTTTPTALADTSAGVWLVGNNSVSGISICVAPTGSTLEADTASAWRSSNRIELRIAASESIFIWQGDRTGLFEGYTDVVYQKISA